MLEDEEIGSVPKVPRNPSLRKRMDCCTEVKTGELPISNLEEYMQLVVCEMAAKQTISC